MAEIYEAICENDHLEWLGEEPRKGRHHVQVTIMGERAPEKRSREEIQRILDETRGAWGTGKTADQIDQEIKEMRKEWDRPWYH